MAMAEREAPARKHRAYSRRREALVGVRLSPEEREGFLRQAASNT
jgi:hypothetical protein